MGGIEAEVGSRVQGKGTGLGDSSTPVLTTVVPQEEEKQKPIEMWKHADQMDAEDPVPLKQCLGSGCVNPTRPGSKYCSDYCGMKLAAE